MRYLEYWTGTDLTAAVTGAGWVTQPLQPRQACRLRLIVTPAPGVERRGYLATVVRATSAGDAARLDEVRAATVWPDTYQPDGVFCSGATTLGDDVFNATGAKQTTTRTVGAGEGTVLYPHFYNDGNVSQCLQIAGTGGDAKWVVQYLEYWTGADITAAVTGAGWQSPALVPGGRCRLKVLVTARFEAQAQDTCDLYLTGTSTIDTTKLDVLRAVTSRR